MEYCPEFKELINRLDELQYIGFGNPNAKILLIGKECSDEPNSFNEENCNKPNLTHWKKILSQETQPENYSFNPLYPFKGLKLKELSGGHLWRKYQKIVDGIIDNNTSEFVDFHQHAFLTELNSVTSRYSKYSLEVKESIHLRCKNLLRDSFFKKFPITIVCCGHYPSQYDIDLEDVFGVKWDKPTKNVVNDKNTKCGWINIHYAEGRILIHTRHLSMCSNALLNNIIELCKPYY